MPIKIKNFKYKNSQGEYVDMISVISNSTNIEFTQSSGENTQNGNNSENSAEN